jgi:hypothetical protein
MNPDEKPFTPPGWDGLTPAEQAGFDRAWAAYGDYMATRLSLTIEAAETASAIQEFANTMESTDFRLALDEAEEVATHPDLVELNVAMDGWYS